MFFKKIAIARKRTNVYSMKLGKAFSVRFPVPVQEYLEHRLAQECPGAKMADILRPIVWEWYKSEIQKSAKAAPIKRPKAKIA